MSVLRATGLAKAFGGVQALQDVGFEVGAGQMLAMIGPNGAGKSTCFNIVNGQLRPDRGSVTLGGREILGLAPRQVWRLGVGRTFQVTATFGSMTVRENVQMVLLSHHGHLGRWWPRAAAQFREQADALLTRVDMVSQAERPCSVLAYGDLKRLELALALANEPRLLLMDEPTAGMAPAERTGLMALTSGIVRERGIAALFTEHDMDVVFGNADRVLVLDRGRVIAEGRPGEVRADPAVRRAYLGSRQ